MTYYTTPPANRPYGKKWYITTEDWYCQWLWSDGSIRNLFVPAGYIYDGMSIPQIAWSLAGMHPDSGRAGVLVHDVLYRAKGGAKASELKGCILTNHNGNTICVDREEADFVLREFMLFSGEEPIKCRRAHRWVRLLGILFWGRRPPTGDLPKEKG